MRVIGHTSACESKFRP